MKEYPPFYVGQKVVALKSDPDPFVTNPVKKGQVYTMLSVKRCGCGLRWSVDVGVRTFPQRFASCGKKDCFYPTHGVAWADANCFAPIDELKEVTFTKMVEEMPVGAN